MSRRRAWANVMMAVTTSPRPPRRPAVAAATEVAVAEMADDIAGALAEATDATAAEGLDAQAVALASAEPALLPEGTELANLSASLDPAAVPSGDEAPVALTISAAPAAAQPVQLVAVSPKPKRKAPIYDEVQMAAAEPVPTEAEVVTRISTTGGRHWGVNVGRFNTRAEAERALLKTQLAESATLGGGLRKIIEKGGAYDANFMGLGQDEADLACRRLQARAVQCFTMGP